MARNTKVGAVNLASHNDPKREVMAPLPEYALPIITCLGARHAAAFIQAYQL